MDVPSRRTGGIYYGWNVLVHIMYAHDDDDGVEAIMPIASLKKNSEHPPRAWLGCYEYVKYVVYSIIYWRWSPFVPQRQYAHHQQ